MDLVIIAFYAVNPAKFQLHKPPSGSKDDVGGETWIRSAVEARKPLIVAHLAYEHRRSIPQGAASSSSAMTTRHRAPSPVSLPCFPRPPLSIPPPPRQSAPFLPPVRPPVRPIQPRETPGNKQKQPLPPGRLPEDPRPDVASVSRQPSRFGTRRTSRLADKASNLPMTNGKWGSECGGEEIRR